MPEQSVKTVKQLKMERIVAKAEFSRLASSLVRNCEDMAEKDLREALSRLAMASEKVLKISEDLKAKLIADMEAELGTGEEVMLSEHQKADLMKTARDCEATRKSIENLVRDTVWSSFGASEVLVALEVAETRCRHVEAVDLGVQQEVDDFLLAHLQGLTGSAKEIHSHWERWIPADLREDLQRRQRELQLKIPQLMARRQEFIWGKQRQEGRVPAPITPLSFPLTAICEPTPNFPVDGFDQGGTPKALEPKEVEIAPVLGADAPGVRGASTATVDASQEPPEPLPQEERRQCDQDGTLKVSEEPQQVEMTPVRGADAPAGGEANTVTVDATQNLPEPMSWEESVPGPVPAENKRNPKDCSGQSGRNETGDRLDGGTKVETMAWANQMGSVDVQGLSPGHEVEDDVHGMMASKPSKNGEKRQLNKDLLRVSLQNPDPLPEKELPCQIGALQNPSASQNAALKQTKVGGNIVARSHLSPQ